MPTPDTASDDDTCAPEPARPSSESPLAGDEETIPADALPDDGDLARQESVFKALANEKRLTILGALRQSELCVCELEAALDAPQSTVATHLRTLKDAGLVRSRTRGKWHYYRIADTATLDVLDLAASMDSGE